MTTVAAFLDITNLYYSVNKRFGKKIDYSKLLEKIASYGEPNRILAYGTYTNYSDVSLFENHLKNLGLETKYKQHVMSEDNQTIVKRLGWDVEMTLDITQICERVSTVVIVSNRREFLPIIEYVKSRAVKVIVIGCGIPQAIRDSANRYYEINETLFEERSDG